MSESAKEGDFPHKTPHIYRACLQTNTTLSKSLKKPKESGGREGSFFRLKSIRAAVAAAIYLSKIHIS
jgi:hypothetical protein